MDRVAFLRSLPYLRQLDPEIWAATTSIGSGNDESQGIYSGSTITPPTPSKNNSLLLFEESAVVSIEPRILGGHRKSNNTTTIDEDDDKMDMGAPVICRKRCRADLDIDAPNNVNHSSSAPAFFQQYKVATEDDVEPKEIDFLSINNDPALCSFEAAIIKHNPNPLGSPVQQDGVDENYNDDDGDKSNWLLFRFGQRFVYLVDTNAIITVTYEPSIDDVKDGSEKSKDTIQSPPMKRQKNTSAEGETAQSDPTNVQKVTRPASLVVSFPFCSFRLFSLQNKTDESAQEGTNGTRSFLLKTVMTEEEKLMKARSLLLKHFELDEEKDKLQNRSASREIMSLGLSVTIQHGFEDEAAIVNSSTPPFLVSKASNFLDEDWSFCVDANKTLPCTSLPSSPQKSTTPSKNEGSSSAKDSSSPFENGQKVGVPENELHESSKEDEGVSNNTDSGIGNKKEDASGEDNLEEGDKRTDSEKKDVDSNDIGDEAISSTKKKEEQNAEHSWKHELQNKRCDFDASWTSVQKAMHNKTTETQTKQDSVCVSHLTRAALSLSSSYLTPKELFDKSSQCEGDIEAATKGIENEIERIFPGRGSRKPTGNPTDLGNFKEKIEHLLRLRKESVDAKLALLLTPKR
jgi:hypothetical protein